MLTVLIKHGGPYDWIAYSEHLNMNLSFDLISAEPETVGEHPAANIRDTVSESIDGWCSVAVKVQLALAAGYHQVNERVKIYTVFINLVCEVHGLGLHIKTASRGPWWH